MAGLVAYICGLIPVTLVFDGSDLRGQAAGSQHAQFGTQFDLFAELVQQLFFALEAAGFHKQGHFVDAAGVGDFNLPTFDFFKAAHDLFNLMRVHKHAHDAGGGVHAAHDAAKARAGAAAGAGARSMYERSPVARRMSG